MTRPGLGAGPSENYQIKYKTMTSHRGGLSPCKLVFSLNRPHGRFSHRVAMSACLSVFCLSVISGAFSKHRLSGPMLSISQNVRLCVCSLLRYRLTVFLPPLPEVGSQNPWGKVMERSGLRYEHIFFFNCLKSPRKKKFFLHFFLLLRYRLTVFLPPLPEVGCPIFLEIQNPWGKVIKRSGLTFEHFCLKVV